MVTRSGTLGVLTSAVDALTRLERIVATVKGREHGDPRFTSALAMLENLSKKEAIPMAIVGGLGALHHGYERLTKDIDIVVARTHLDPLIRVAPKYGIKVIWQDPQGWHKLIYHGVDIHVVPEGGTPQPRAPTTIPGPKQLGVRKGTAYADLAGWLETKLGSNRVQDRADVVQVMKKLELATLRRARGRIAKIHPVYLRRFDELHAASQDEKEQERWRGGPR
jgi:hypothetical protein